VYISSNTWQQIRYWFRLLGMLGIVREVKCWWRFALKITFTNTEEVEVIARVVVVTRV